MAQFQSIRRWRFPTFPARCALFFRMPSLPNTVSSGRMTTDSAGHPKDLTRGRRAHDAASMQDRYAGDVGDFMKFGLLRALTSTEGAPHLGVNWYRTADESHNADGKHVSYLEPSNHCHRALRDCDPELMVTLATVVQTGRSVAALESAGVLPPGTPTWPAQVGSGLNRADWHSGALAALAGAELVFADPDNGLRTDRHCVDPVKFAFCDELADYARRGQSLIVYHHADRSKGGVPVQVTRRLGELTDATGLTPVGAVVARRGSCRFFLVAATETHVDQLSGTLAAYASRWYPDAELVSP
jgi:hypothetical protein